MEGHHQVQQVHPPQEHHPQDHHEQQLHEQAMQRMHEQHVQQQLDNQHHHQQSVEQPREQAPSLDGSTAMGHVVAADMMHREQHMLQQHHHHQQQPQEQPQHHLPQEQHHQAQDHQGQQQHQAREQQHQGQQHHQSQEEQAEHRQHNEHHEQMHQENDDDLDHNALQVAAEDIITAVNSIGDNTSGLDNGLGEPTPQEQAALVEALAAASGPAPPLLLQAEKCLSIQEIVNLCREFEMCDKISRREFAKARDVSRTKFDRYWKNYRIGKYNNVKLANKRRRVKPGKYLPVETKLVEFLEERKASGIKNDLSWIVLSEKALELAKEVLPEEMQGSFRASAGWLYGVLHRNGFIHVDLTGNDNNIASGAPTVAAPSMKAPPKLTPQPAIVVNGDVTMV